MSTPPPLVTVPILDLAGAGGSPRPPEAVAADLQSIASRSGVFLLRGHGVAPALLDAQLALGRSFFALDVAEKMMIDVATSNCFRGYEPFASQRIGAHPQLDRKEGFIMGPELAPDHPHVVARLPNTGSNLWPAHPPGFRAQMTAYVDAMVEVGRRLASVLARSVGMPADYFTAGLREPLAYSQLFHYPALPQRAEPDAFGAAPHRDWGMLTILLQDDVGGLEVQADDGGWVPATPLAETLVVILGEMIPRLTNGRYRSALHRVVANTSGRSRYSMPTFIDPDYDTAIGVLLTCLAQGEEPPPAVTVAQHMLEMAARRLSHADG